MAPLEYPFGRGINLQIEVPDVDHVHAQALRSGATIYVPLEECWYRQGDEEAGNRSSSSSTQMAISFASSATSAGGTGEGSFDRSRAEGV
jgi:hypothetical protein